MGDFCERRSICSARNARYLSFISAKPCGAINSMPAPNAEQSTHRRLYGRYTSQRHNHMPWAKYRPHRPAQRVSGQNKGVPAWHTKSSSKTSSSSPKPSRTWPLGTTTARYCTPTEGGKSAYAQTSKNGGDGQRASVQPSPLEISRGKK